MKYSLAVHAVTVLLCLCTKVQPAAAQTHPSDVQNVDSSHVIVAAIKSVSGTIPIDEFFAASWRIRYTDWFYSISTLDVALSNRGTDSVRSSARRLTDAGLMTAVDIAHFAGMDFRRRAKTGMFVAPVIKIFNAEVYYGGALGGIELKNSAMFSSYFYLAYVRRFFDVTDESRFNADGQRLADDNLFTEFFLYSPKIPFFKLLAFRGGVLVPLLGNKGNFDDVQFRITVAVPVGEVFTF